MILKSNLPSSDSYENYNALRDLIRKQDALVFNVGAEIGVRHALTSQHLLENFPELVMYLIDPYTPYMDLEYWFSQEEQEKIKTDARNKLKPYNGRAIWNYLSSLEASKNCIDRMFDFVFIDAEHTYEAARLDLRCWYPKVRMGGLFVGHDFSMDAVKTAVTEFADELQQDVFHVNGLADIWYMYVE